MPEGGIRSQTLGLRGLFELCSSCLKMVGTANATGLIAAGAGFQTFAKTPALQYELKLVILWFLLGVVTFAIAYMCLTLTIIYADNFLMALSERAEWEKTFWLLNKLPSYYSKIGRFWFYASLMLGLATMGCFTAGLYLVSGVALRL